MSNFFDVFVGNLPVTISQQNLRDLFCPMGQIASVWIKSSSLYDRFTYGFVSFYNLDEAKMACQIFNSKQFDKLMIKVNLSFKIGKKLSNCVTAEDLSMISSLPKTRYAEPCGIIKIDCEKINLQDIIRYY